MRGIVDVLLFVGALVSDRGRRGEGRCITLELG